MKLRDWVDVMSAEDMPTDSHGNPVADWSSAVALREPAQVVPLSSSENITGQDTVVSRWQVFLLASTTATALSRLHWRGDTYEVDGEVQLFTDNRGRPHHHEAFLKRVSG